MFLHFILFYLVFNILLSHISTFHFSSRYSFSLAGLRISYLLPHYSAFHFLPFQGSQKNESRCISLSLSLITIEGSKWGSKRCKWARFGTAEAGNWEWVDGRKRSVRVVEAGREGKRSSTRSPSHSKQSCITIYLKSGSATRKWARRLPTQTTSSPLRST